MNNILLNIWSDTFIIIGMGLCMVFFILLLLIFIIQSLHKVLLLHINFRRKKTPSINSHSEKNGKTTPATVSLGESAAIAMALHLYYFEEIHDEENAIITIKKIEKRYSPWSSKIYGMNQTNLK